MCGFHRLGVWTLLVALLVRKLLVYTGQMVELPVLFGVPTTLAPKAKADADSATVMTTAFCPQRPTDRSAGAVVPTATWTPTPRPSTVPFSWFGPVVFGAMMNPKRPVQDLESVEVH